MKKNQNTIIVTKNLISIKDKQKNIKSEEKKTPHKWIRGRITQSRSLKSEFTKPTNQLSRTAKNFDNFIFGDNTMLIKYFLILVLI